MRKYLLVPDVTVAREVAGGPQALGCCGTGCMLEGVITSLFLVEDREMERDFETYRSNITIAHHTRRPSSQEGEVGLLTVWLIPNAAAALAVAAIDI